jgi:hypothetical protein
MLPTAIDPNERLWLSLLAVFLAKATIPGTIKIWQLQTATGENGINRMLNQRCAAEEQAVAPRSRAKEKPFTPRPW